MIIIIIIIIIIIMNTYNVLNQPINPIGVQ